jgi:hypothetical protein
MSLSVPQMHIAHQPCEVERLAREAARVLRAMQALGHSELRTPETEALEDGDFPAVVRLRDQSIDLAVTQRALFDQLHAIHDLASHYRPTSHKGALFQLYLAGTLISGVTGSVLQSRMDRDDFDELRRLEARGERLVRSVVACLEADLSDDEDLAIIRKWFFFDQAEALPVIEQAAPPPGLAR